MIYSLHVLNKSLNNVIKPIYTHININLYNRTHIFKPLYYKSIYICGYYDRKYFTSDNIDDKTSELSDLSNTIGDSTEDSTQDISKSSIITRDSNNLTFSLIQDAFDTVADEYNKNISCKEFINEDNEFSVGFSSDFDGMTPAQKFYSENKEKLINNAKKIFLESSGKIDSICNVDEPVIRPPKNHVWEYGSVTISDYKEQIVLKKGQMPTINEIIKILEREHFVDSVTINLDECNRRDIGLYVIVSTGKTFSHCRRVGRLLYRIFVDLEIPFVSEVSYARSSRNDQWIIAHLGPLHVYLMTQDLRELYKLEELWSNNDITTDVIESNNTELMESRASDDKIVYQNDIVYDKFKKDDDYG